MLQQTTVKTVVPYFSRFVDRWSDIHALAAAPLDEVLLLWAGLGYYARARNLHACAQAVAARGGFPRSERELAELPGIGRYTAAAIAAIAFGARTVPVDGNIERVVARLFAVDAALPAAKATIHRFAQSLAPHRRSGDFAQALMDLGASLCSPAKPACVLCPWMSACAACRQGNPEDLPRRTPKPTGVLRRGAAFVALRDDGCILLRTRPAAGLLGGMSEVPTTDFASDFAVTDAFRYAPPFARQKPNWRRIPGAVKHVFTHFPLELYVYAANLPRATQPPDGARWVPLEQLAGEALPTLMQKVLQHALSAAPASPQRTDNLRRTGKKIAAR